MSLCEDWQGHHVPLCRQNTHKGIFEGFTSQAILILTFLEESTLLEQNQHVIGTNQQITTNFQQRDVWKGVPFLVHTRLHMG